MLLEGVVLVLQHSVKLPGKGRGLLWLILNHFELYVHLEPVLSMLFAWVVLVPEHQVKLRESRRGLLWL